MNKEKANIKSSFSFGEEAWWLNGSHIMSGVVVSIRGEANSNFNSIELSHTSGEMGCNFLVKEEDCFKSRHSLVNIITGNNTNIERLAVEATATIILLFEEKHGYEFSYWVGDEPGGIACFIDQYFFNFAAS